MKTTRAPIHTFAPAPGLLAHLTLANLGAESPESLETSGFGCDAWGMDTNAPPSSIANRTPVVRCNQDEMHESLQEDAGTIDAMASFLTTGSRIDHACTLALRANRDIRSESALAEAIACKQTTLRAMRAETYNAPRSAEGWDAVKRLALLARLSFEWIKFGDSKTPVALSDDEAASLRAELAPAIGAGAAAPSAQAGQLSIISQMLFAQVWLMVCTSERAQREGWDSGDAIPCAILLYNAIIENPARKTDPTYIAAFINSHNVLINKLV